MALPDAIVRLQRELPPQTTLLPFSTVTWHCEPPPHSTALFVPAAIVQSLVPVQVDVQSVPQVLAQVDSPAHFMSQPEPHAVVQVFIASQL